MSNPLFIAKFSYGRAALCKAEIVRETPKTYVVTSQKEQLIGTSYHYTTWLYKSDPNCHRSVEDALAFLIDKAEEWVVTCQDKTSRALAQYEMLKAMEE